MHATCEEKSIKSLCIDQAAAIPSMVTAVWNLTQPGAYVCHWSGHLLRVPDGAVRSEGLAAFDMIGHGPLVLTKVSDNPFAPISEARMTAANLDLPIQF